MSGGGGEQANIELDFVEFMRSQYRAIYTDAYFVLYDQDQAMEIADEAFFRAYVRWKKISRFDKPGAWVRRVTIRLATRFRVRKKREGAEMPADMAARSLDTDAALDLRYAMKSLSPRQRAAVVLHYYEDLPISDVAEQLGCRESTAGRYLFDARARLRDLLS